MHLRLVHLAAFLGYIVYGYENSNKLSKEDRTVSRYRFLQADWIILVWHEDTGAGPTRSRVRLTGTVCKCNDGAGRAVIKQALDD